MKNLLPFAFCAAVFLYSCTSNKSTIAPSSGISADINGVNEKFNLKDSIRAIGNSGIYFSGGNGTADTSDRIAFYLINSSAPVTPGTYTSLNQSPDVQIFYEKGGPWTNDYFYNEGSNYSVTINVTSISPTNIQGTFSGKLILESMVNSESPKTVTITNGKFNVTQNLQ